MVQIGAVCPTAEILIEEPMTREKKQQRHCQGVEGKDSSEEQIERKP